MLMLRVVVPTVLCLLLVACARPDPLPAALVSGFTPETAEVTWVHGRAIAEQAQNGLRVKVSFLEASRDTLLFEVEAINQGASPVLITPERLRIDRVDYTLDRPSVSFPAVDPEHQIELLAQDAHRIRERAKADADFQVGMGLLGMAFGVVGAVDSSRPGGARADSMIGGVAAAGAGFSGALETSKQEEGQLAALKENGKRWEDACLRRTTLDSGQRYRGMVVFHMDPSHAVRLVLYVPTDAGTFTFPFRLKGVSR